MNSTDLGILTVICQQGGKIAFDDLVDMGVAPLMYLDNILNRQHDMFSVVYQDGQKFVTVRTKIELCTEQGCEFCFGLHICKKYLLGECDNKR